MAETALYNKIGVDYNETRRADEFLTERFRAFLSPVKGENYLDVGCGTGNYTCALSGEEYQFYGVDLSETMLEKARRRNCRAIWKNASAEDLPFENALFAGALATLTIHHWKDLKKAFREIYRVLKPNGRFVLFTSFPEQMEGYWLNHYFPKMMRASIEQMPAFSVIEKTLKSAGFAIENTENYFVRDDLQDHFLYCGKNRPEFYLREDIRKGISSFSALANKTEVEKGLLKLSEDIEKGKIFETIENYRNDKGDYVFSAACKV
jgi:ubiquinone/menaquinone biosynthesis C-methylase UbiE